MNDWICAVHCKLPAPGLAAAWWCRCRHLHEETQSIKSKESPILVHLLQQYSARACHTRLLNIVVVDTPIHNSSFCPFVKELPPCWDFCVHHRLVLTDFQDHLLGFMLPAAQWQPFQVSWRKDHASMTTWCSCSKMLLMQSNATFMPTNAVLQCNSAINSATSFFLAHRCQSSSPR